MPSLLRMPAPAAGAEEAMLLEWSVDEKAEFAESDVLLVIETDKAVIEVEAESDGVLHRRLVPAGERVAVGTPLAVIGSPGDSAEVIAGLVAQASGGQAASEPPMTKDPVPAPPTALAPAAPAPTGPVPQAVGTSIDGAASRDIAGYGRIFASPIARQMAKTAGITLTELAGTGPGGRIVRRDVEAAVARRDSSSAPAASAPAGAPASGSAPSARRTGAADRTFTDEPHSKVRAAIASRLTFSKQTVPHFYVRATPQVDALLALRAELNSGRVDGEPKVSVNDLVVRAVARAHRLVPAMNVTFGDTATRHYDFVDVAVAIATDGGLVTPVLRDVDRLPLSEIAAATADFASRARNGRLRQQELEGGSITVTNLGMFAVEEFAAIINPPHSAILAVGAARLEPVAVEGANGPELAAARVMHLVLSVDHRAVDGALAARWMAALTDLLEHPVRILT
ncbi:MAG: hypothetical protein BGO26_09665 [Actinobacteria bacterium 69-20]|nr:2-oxo acid dehydrogenase subunit E2 [Actinomycetota bacterium]OJV23189.1 MAG: hypothetical protein BGO26_09665 [Actinobacteria bacterium 69-20]